MLRFVTALAASAFLAQAAQAQTVSSVYERLHDIEDQLDRHGSDLSPNQLTSANDLLDRVLTTIAAGSTSTLLCMPSERFPGKACYQTADQPNTCQGNYFASPANCAKAKAAIIRNFSCFESESKPGQAFIALVQPTVQPIQNYFTTGLDDCVKSARRINGQLMCLPSASRPGQFFIGDLANNGAVIGNYFASQDACLDAL